jgi:hypothetical protein
MLRCACVRSVQHQGCEFAPAVLTALESLDCAAAVDVGVDGRGACLLPCPSFRVPACVWAAAATGCGSEGAGRGGGAYARQVALLGALRTMQDEGAWVLLCETALTHGDVGAASAAAAAALKAFPHSARLWTMVRCRPRKRAACFAVAALVAVHARALTTHARRPLI